MNKLTKRTLLAAAALCVIGGILLAVGIGSGGLRFLASTNLTTMEPIASSSKLYEENKTKLDEFSSLNIDVAYLDLTVLPSEDDSCYLSYNVSGSSRENPFKYAVNNGTLSIKEDHSAASQFFVGVDYSFLAQVLTGRIVTDGPDPEYDSMTLYLPAGKQLNDAVISGGDGDISIRGLQADQFTLESSYGNLELSDTSARSSSFSLGDGDADMDSVTLEQVDFDTSYGDVTMKNSSFGAVTLHAGDGDVTCENNTFTGNCEFTLSYGDAFFRLDDQQKAALSMEFQTDYGDITITESLPNGAFTQFEDEDAKRYEKTGTAEGGTLSVACDDGDITLK